MQEWVKDTGREGLHRLRGSRHGWEGRHDQGGSPSESARGSSGSSRCRRPTSGRSRRCTSSATSPTFPPPGRSSSSTAAGTTARASSGSWAFAPRRSPTASSSWCRRSSSAMVDSGILLVKYWLEVSQEEQTRRLQSRIDDPRKIWKLSGHGPAVLWPLVRLLPCARHHVRARPTRRGLRGSLRDTNDKKRGRLNIISHLLSQRPLRTADTRGRPVADAAGCQRLHRARPAPAPHPHAVLTLRHPPVCAAIVLRWRRTWEGARWRVVLARACCCRVP